MSRRIVVCRLNVHRAANPHGCLFAKYLQDLWYKHESFRAIRSEAEDYGTLLVDNKERRRASEKRSRRQLHYPLRSSLTWVTQISWCKFEASVSDPKDVIPTVDGAPEPPPLTIMSLAVRTVVNHRENKREVVCVSARIWRDGRLCLTTWSANILILVCSTVGRSDTTRAVALFSTYIRTSSGQIPFQLRDPGQSQWEGNGITCEERAYASQQPSWQVFSRS